MTPKNATSAPGSSSVPEIHAHEAFRKYKLIDLDYRDWQINVIFYTALHAVDAAVAKLGLRVSDHSERNDVA